MSGRPVGGVGSLFLVDANNFMFRAYHGLPMLNAPDGTPVNAVHGYVRMLQALRREFAPESLLAVFDSDASTTNYSLITSVESPNRTANSPWIVENNGGNGLNLFFNCEDPVEAVDAVRSTQPKEWAPGETPWPKAPVGANASKMTGLKDEATK